MELKLGVILRYEGYQNFGVFRKIVLQLIAPSHPTEN
jgi:hypothetical protein